VGKIIGNKVGMCKKAILSNIFSSIFLLELLLTSSIKSIDTNNIHAKENIIAKEKKFSLIKYLKTSLLLKIIFFLTYVKKMELVKN
tara:strand:+ start:367 stop:624 length:258 start_codon:yes stop_codon:yes gene_type:complete